MATSIAEPPAVTPFERIGGHAAFRAITERFYDLMNDDPKYAELRAIHAADLAPMRDSLPLFLAGWAGGPRDWFERNPGKCMMSAHAALAITPATASQWAEAMRRAIADTPLADRELATALSEALERLARGMARG